MNDTTHDSETLRTEVRRRYGSIAEEGSTLADGASPKDPCCSSALRAQVQAGSPTCCSTLDQALTLGYTESDLAAVPDGANLGLGCGNPVALASLKEGQVVLDLGSGAGFDAFLAARAVGSSGRIIGVDMTPEMITKARANASKGNYPNVEFRLGEIEALPVADQTVDVVISNCVINLCPDKAPVYREAFRVLRPEGRIAVSDVVARGELSTDIKQDLALYSGCLAGATPHSDLVRILEETGFTEISIRPKGNSEQVITSWDAKHGLEKAVFAAEVTAVKPRGQCCTADCCS